MIPAESHPTIIGMVFFYAGILYTLSIGGLGFYFLCSGLFRKRADG